MVVVNLGTLAVTDVVTITIETVVNGLNNSLITKSSWEMPSCLKQVLNLMS